MDFVKFSVTLWAVWTARRKAIHEGIFQSPLGTKILVDRFVSELDMSNTAHHKMRTAVDGLSAHVVKGKGKVAPTWKRAPLGVAKIYAQAGFNSDETKCAVVAVCRDDQGTYLGSSALVIQGITDQDTATALACYESLSLADDLLLRKVVITCDSKLVIQAIEQGVGGLYEMVTNEINARRRSFLQSDLVFEGRSLNLDAFNLAKFACNLLPGRHVWLSTTHDPNCILPVILLEQ